MWGSAQYDSTSASNSNGRRSSSGSQAPPGSQTTTRGGAAAGGRRARRRRNQQRQERWRSEYDAAGFGEDDDVLAPYYQSKLPAEGLAIAAGPWDAAGDQQGDQHRTQQERGAATLRADELVALAVQHLATETPTPHVLIRTPDILWLHAGSPTNAETVIRQKCLLFGEVQRIKVFPRQSFAAVSFAGARAAASAQIALDNHTIYCGPLAVSFLQQFLSREAILACQHLPPPPPPPPAAAAAAAGALQGASATQASSSAAAATQAASAATQAVSAAAAAATGSWRPGAADSTCIGDADHADAGSADQQLHADVDSYVEFLLGE